MHNGSQPVSAWLPSQPRSPRRFRLLTTKSRCRNRSLATNVCLHCVVRVGRLGHVRRASPSRHVRRRNRHKVALEESASRADELAPAGDDNGVAVWRRISDVVGHLVNTTPARPLTCRDTGGDKPWVGDRSSRVQPKSRPARAHCRRAKDGRRSAPAPRPKARRAARPPRPKRASRRPRAATVARAGRFPHTSTPRSSADCAAYWPTARRNDPGVGLLPIRYRIWNHYRYYLINI
jgi:hypothetical protein